MEVKSEPLHWVRWDEKIKSFDKTGEMQLLYIFSSSKSFEGESIKIIYSSFIKILFYQTRHFFTGFILLPDGHLKAFENATELENGPIILKEKYKNATDDISRYWKKRSWCMKSNNVQFFGGHSVVYYNQFQSWNTWTFSACVGQCQSYWEQLSYGYSHTITINIKKGIKLN